MVERTWLRHEMEMVDVPRGGRIAVGVTLGASEDYFVQLRDHAGLPSWVALSSHLPRDCITELSPSWDEVKRLGSAAIRKLVIKLPDDHPVTPGATSVVTWRIRDMNPAAPETPQEPRWATQAVKQDGDAHAAQDAPETPQSGSHVGVSPMVDGWMVESVEVEEYAPWRNKMTIDLVCDDSGVIHGRGYGMNAMLARPVDRGYEVVPTIVGYAPASLKLDKGDETDRDIEMVLRDVPLFWGEKHELHLSVRGERTHITLPFVLAESMKTTDIQEIKRLEAHNVIRSPKFDRRPEITGKVKLTFQFPFDGEDRWFHVSNSNVHIWRSERLCRRNDEGRCAVMAYLRHGLNKVQICPYDPDSGLTGRAVTIEVHNPF